MLRSPIRSLLFCPANDGRKVEKALASAATLAVADLEDSVPLDQKEQARSVLAARRGPRGPAGLAIRINALDGPFVDDDLALVREVKPDAIVVPKASASLISAALGDDSPPVIAIVETPTGLQESAAIAAAPAVVALLLGGVDLTLSLRLGGRPDGLDLLLCRSQLVIDSAAAQIQPPIDGVHPAIADLDGLREETELARSLGCGGKACIHPSHLSVIEAVFRPSPAEVDWASRVVAAFSEAERSGQGATTVDGEMVDRPVVLRAERVLAEAGMSATR